MQSSSNDATPQALRAPGAETPSGGKLAWHTPQVEEVPFTRTEAGGGGATYDAGFYSFGSI
ncbi:MAG TPA: hypothetical protein VF710_17425 [Longimicrobium sp.]|jgi:hypothetical protein